MQTDRQTNKKEQKISAEIRDVSNYSIDPLTGEGRGCWKRSADRRRLRRGRGEGLRERQSASALARNRQSAAAAAAARQRHPAARPPLPSRVEKLFLVSLVKVQAGSHRQLRDSHARTWEVGGGRWEVGGGRWEVGREGNWKEKQGKKNSSKFVH